MARLGPEHGGYGSIKSSVGCSERGPVGCVGGEAIWEWSGGNGPYLQRTRSLDTIQVFGSTILSQINYFRLIARPTVFDPDQVIAAKREEIPEAMTNYRSLS